MAANPDRLEALRARLREVTDEIARHRDASARAAPATTLVVVTKAAPPQVFDDLAALGVRDVGESRVQAAEERRAGHEGSFRWHLVGHLQANKARRAVAQFDVFHGVDSVALMHRLDRVAGELGRAPELLLQVNVSGESSKHGLPPDALPEALDAAAGLAHARLIGLMTMAPLVEAVEPVEPLESVARVARAERAELARSVFARLASLRSRYGAPPELSMGMSDDFGVAVEEGATLVRVGRRIVAPPGVG